MKVEYDKETNSLILTMNRYEKYYMKYNFDNDEERLNYIYKKLFKLYSAGFYGSRWE